MSFEYLKLNRSYLTDVKFLKLPDSTKWHYWGCCLIAGEAKAEGYIAQNHNPMTIEDIALAIRCDIEELNKSFSLLLKLNFIVLEDDFYYIVRFLEEQGPAERRNGDTKDMRGYWRESQKKHRNKLTNPNKNQEQEEELRIQNKNQEKEQEKEYRIRIRSVNDNVNDKENNDNSSLETEEESSMPF
jgi:hypothetical protein